MKLTKFDHSCIIVEKNGMKVVCDPVEFETSLPELDNVAAIIVTHKHGDHLQPERISAILDRSPEAQILTTADAVEEFDRATAVHAGDSVNLGGFELRFFGQDHGEIVPGEVPCENIGVVIDNLIVNPGDSFDIPEDLAQPEVLLVPSVAPWCKASESMAYIEAVHPKIALPVHNALLSEFGNGVYNNWLRAACQKTGSEFAPLSSGESIDL